MPGVVKVLTSANRKPALGRGLGALLHQESRPAAPAAGGVTRLPVDQVQADRANPRKTFDEAALEELAVSLKQHGVLQPVLVRRDSKGGYRLIAGERRWRAAQRAGLREIPAIIRESSDAEAYELALIENIQRADLNPLEEAEAFRRLLDERRLSQDQIADRLGKDRSTIANALRLLTLPNEVKQLLAEGDLDMGHARALLALDGAAQVTTAHEVVAKKLSVRDTEKLVARNAAGRQQPLLRTANEKPRDLLRLEEELSDLLASTVEIRVLKSGKKNQSGELAIAFGSLDALQGVIERLRGTP